MLALSANEISPSSSSRMEASLAPHAAPTLLLRLTAARMAPAKMTIPVHISKPKGIMTTLGFMPGMRMQMSMRDVKTTMIMYTAELKA